MKRALLLVICILVVGNLVAVDVEYATDGMPSLDEAVGDLRAITKEWQRNDTDFRAQRRLGGMSDDEAREYAEFVAGLKRQVFEGCRTVRELDGDPEQLGIDCKLVEGESASQAGPSKMTSRGPTREEQAEQLWAELKTLEAEFDGMILIQQGKIRRKASSSPPAGGWGSPGTNSGEEPSDAAGSEVLAGGAETAAQADPMERQGEPGTSPGVKKQGKPPARQLPEGVSDGSDDDVVARQLREAAEAESDPILRKQLWEEYIKYKNSTK